MVEFVLRVLAENPISIGTVDLYIGMIRDDTRTQPVKVWALKNLNREEIDHEQTDTLLRLLKDIKQWHSRRS